MGIIMRGQNRSHGHAPVLVLRTELLVQAISQWVKLVVLKSVKLHAKEIGDSSGPAGKVSQESNLNCVDSYQDIYHLLPC
jgi:hypothetical protein